MATSLPHRAAPLQRGLAASLALHAVVGACVALLAPRPSGPAPAPARAVEATPIEIEEGAEVEPPVLAAPSVEPGREERAQGDAERADDASPSPAPTAPAPSAAPPPAIDPRPPAERPRPDTPPPPKEPPPAALPLEPDPPARPPTPAPARRSPASRSPTARADATPATPPAASSSGAPPLSSASPPRPASGSGGEVPGGDGGGVARPRARDLAAAFTRELPPACDAMEAWRTLPEGDLGAVEVELETDEEGRLTGDTRLVPSVPPAPWIEVVRRTRARLGRAPSALDAAGAGAGSIRLRLAGKIERVPVPPGAETLPFGLRATFRDGEGEAGFTLPEGRRITVSLRIVAVARGAGG